MCFLDAVHTWSPRVGNENLMSSELTVSADGTPVAMSVIVSGGRPMLGKPGLVISQITACHCIPTLPSIEFKKSTSPTMISEKTDN